MMIFALLLTIAAGIYTGYCAGRTHASLLAGGEDDLTEDDDDDGDDIDAGDEDDDVDVCLRVGMPVVCRLSETSHTHGVILGFAIGSAKDGSMLAIVDVGRAPAMAIDVDKVEPHMARSPEAGYRESADPNKQWN